MMLVHYQTLEAVTPKEFEVLKRIAERFNEGRNFREKIRFWRKSDILAGLTPSNARWGFTRVFSDVERQHVLSTIRRMSKATPRLTWMIYESNGGKEIVLRGGGRVS